MYRLVIRPWLLFTVLLVSVTTHADAKESGPQTLTVRILGFRNTNGQAIVGLFAAEASWLKTDKATQRYRVKIKGQELTIQFRNVTPGIYGISVVHDENRNGKLDMRWLPYPKPKEGGGVSGNRQSRLGPPHWDDATIEMGNTDKTISISLRYP